MRKKKTENPTVKWAETRQEPSVAGETLAVPTRARALPSAPAGRSAEDTRPETRHLHPLGQRVGRGLSGDAGNAHGSRIPGEPADVHGRQDAACASRSAPVTSATQLRRPDRLSSTRDANAGGAGNHIPEVEQGQPDGAADCGEPPPRAGGKRTGGDEGVGTGADGARVRGWVRASVRARVCGAPPRSSHQPPDQLGPVRSIFPVPAGPGTARPSSRSVSPRLLQ